MSNCIFCKIITGEIPSVKLYEDELVFAFLDIAPINYGHLLIIPKEHYTSPATIPENTAGKMFYIAGKFGIALKRAVNAEGFNFHLADGSCAGQVVAHTHLHVIPRHPEDGFHWGWRQKRYESDAKRNELAERIKEKLKY